jgi:hypothetical protein
MKPWKLTKFLYFYNRTQVTIPFVKYSPKKSNRGREHIHKKALCFSLNWQKKNRKSY